jgi:hypothetical protein
MTPFLLHRGLWLARRVLLAFAVTGAAWPSALVLRTLGDGWATPLAAVATAAAVSALGALLLVARRAPRRALLPGVVALAVAAAWTPVVAVGSIGLAWGWSVLFGAILAWALASGLVSLARAGRDAVLGSRDGVVVGTARVVDAQEALPR